MPSVSVHVSFVVGVPLSATEIVLAPTVAVAAPSVETVSEAETGVPSARVSVICEPLTFGLP